MELFLSVAAVIAVLALDWVLRAVFVMPLPDCVDMVFVLDAENASMLEHAARGFRYLKNHRLVHGRFCIVLCSPSQEGLKLAQLIAKQPDIVLMEHECGQNCPK